AYEGNCAFRFKGGTSEHSQLIQKLDVSGTTFAEGENFTFEIYIRAPGKREVGARAKFTYASGMVERGIVLNPSDPYPDYRLYSGEYTLAASDLVKIKVWLKNKSLSGKIDVDAVRLSYTPSNIRLMPLP
ncbi:MAG TPA: hypothetical protein VHL11_02460, partial [Phototrophicaceae bacterium]|nr:hypothetical protein [Phototrophicaceae bacterium]